MKKTSKHTHSDLNAIAVKWLRRPNNYKNRDRSGASCICAFSEVISSSHSGEVADAIGFKTADGTETFLCEIKVSMSDFKKDKLKPHRQNPSQGMGNYRYYVVPELLGVTVDDLPDKWGLITVSERGVCSVKHGLGITGRKEDFYFESNRDAEVALLTLLMKKIADPTKLVNDRKEIVRKMNNENRRANSIKASLDASEKRTARLYNALSKYISDEELVSIYMEE
ncbi:conserved hypothetical protein [Vibrio chagasii]|nr:conserved hypothetical protein [Vibrio chagasii]